MKKWLGVALAVALLLGVVAAVVLGTGRGGGGIAAGGGPRDLTVVTGVVGSEKKPYFEDPEVKRVLAEHGYEVRIDTAGSREIASLPKLEEYDFAFPSSTPAADRIRKEHTTNGTVTPFSTPMAVATFAPIVDALRPTGIFTTGKNGQVVFHVDRYLATVGKRTRWNEVKGNEAYPASKSVLVTTSDVRKSNSAAMFLALAAYVANDGAVVRSKAQEQKVLPQVAPLFLDQGYSDSSSDGPFEDYLSIGMGKTPMVLCYEAQFLERQLAKDGSIGDDMVLAHPVPDVTSKHTVVSFSAPGKELGRLLAEDPELQRLAAIHGFRPRDRAVFAAVLKDKGVKAPPELIDVIEPPAYERLEGLIVGIEKKY